MYGGNRHGASHKWPDEISNLSSDREWLQPRFRWCPILSQFLNQMQGRTLMIGTVQRGSGRGARGLPKGRGEMMQGGRGPDEGGE